MIPLDQPLDLRSPEARQFLAGVQGNILKSHGRNHAVHLFLRFGPQVADARRWIKSFAESTVTSAAQQQAQSAAWRSKGGPGELFSSFLLSFAGYAALGVPPASIPQEPGRTYFQRGMKNQAAAERTFNDPPKDQWEAPYQGELHALIILAHDDVSELNRNAAAIQSSVAPFANELFCEPGDRLEYDFPRGRLTIEHFGFEDGISNPILTLQDAETERAQRGYDKWDPAGPLSLVLSAEPAHADRFGSFLVFRKLEQKVRDFHAALQGVAKTRGDSDAELAGAMAVGRFRDGSPVVPTSAPVPGAELNNFNYEEGDPTGGVCPFHAHIRKTNPRGDTPLGAGERAFRIARRGITYGSRPDLAPNSKLPTPNSGVGLLFMSYQAKLDQFAIQQEGSDSNDFVNPGVGVDAVIGQNSAPIPQEWPAGSGYEFTMANFVKLLGGEYFFAPSLAFLKEL